jgi:hypothetical protein
MRFINRMARIYESRLWYQSSSTSTADITTHLLRNWQQDVSEHPIDQGGVCWMSLAAPARAAGGATMNPGIEAVIIRRTIRRRFGAVLEKRDCTFCGNYPLSIQARLVHSRAIR